MREQCDPHPPLRGTLPEGEGLARKMVSTFGNRLNPHWVWIGDDGSN